MFQDDSGSLRTYARQAPDEMKSALRLRAGSADRIVDERTVALRLRAHLHDQRHEGNLRRARARQKRAGVGGEAGEQDRHLVSNGETRKNAPNVVLAVGAVEVRPKAARDAVDNDESLLVGSSQLVRLIEELTVLQGTKEIGGALVLDSEKVAVRIVTDFDQSSIDVPIREDVGNPSTELVNPSGLFPQVYGQERHHSPPGFTGTAVSIFKASLDRSDSPPKISLNLGQIDPTHNPSARSFPQLCSLYVARFL